MYWNAYFHAPGIVEPQRCIIAEYNNCVIILPVGSIFAPFIFDGKDWFNLYSYDGKDILLYNECSIELITEQIERINVVAKGLKEEFERILRASYSECNYDMVS